MPDIRSPLSKAELELLGDFLLDRIDEESVKPGDDEGIFEISGLDGFFTAIVSGPVTILPSQWLPSLWGEFPPVFESREEFEAVFSLLIRHMNSISVMLMERPDDFAPLFYERVADERRFTIVDEWCEGYMRAMELALELGARLDPQAEELLHPIREFTEAADWAGHDLNDYPAIEALQQSIAPNVRALHAYWLAQRAETAEPKARPHRRDSPRIGRNDPCPCGSGKKFKKCCLH